MGAWWPQCPGGVGTQAASRPGALHLPARHPWQSDSCWLTSWNNNREKPTSPAWGREGSSHRRAPRRQSQEKALNHLTETAVPQQVSRHTELVHGAAGGRGNPLLCQRQQFACHSVWVTCETKSTECSPEHLEITSSFRAMLGFGMYSQKVGDTPPFPFPFIFPFPLSPFVSPFPFPFLFFLSFPLSFPFLSFPLSFPQTCSPPIPRPPALTSKN